MSYGISRPVLGELVRQSTDYRGCLALLHLYGIGGPRDERQTCRRHNVIGPAFGEDTLDLGVSETNSPARNALLFVFTAVLDQVVPLGTFVAQTMNQFGTVPTLIRNKHANFQSVQSPPPLPCLGRALDEAAGSLEVDFAHHVKMYATGLEWLLGDGPVATRRLKGLRRVASVLMRVAHDGHQGPKCVAGTACSFKQPT